MGGGGQGRGERPRRAERAPRWDSRREKGPGCHSQCSATVGAGRLVFHLLLREHHPPSAKLSRHPQIWAEVLGLGFMLFLGAAPSHGSPCSLIHRDTGPRGSRSPRSSLGWRDVLDWACEMAGRRNKAGRADTCRDPCDVPSRPGLPFS